MVTRNICPAKKMLILVFMMLVNLISAQNGNVGIGTTDPDTTLHVVGKVKIEDGSQQHGRLLVSDSTGTASWEALTGAHLLPAQPMATFESCLNLSGVLQIGPNPNEVDVVGDYAYVVDRTTEDLKIINISNPMKPALVDSVGIGMTPIDIRVLDGYAYVVDSDDSDLKVIDVTDPSSPSISGSLTFNFTPEAVDVQGSYAFVVGQAIGVDTIKVIDVSNPDLPVVVGDLGIGATVQAVSVLGSYAYVVDSETDDLIVIDISNPASPSQSGSLPIGPHPDGVVVRGTYAYILESLFDTLLVVDVSNPAMPFQAGSVFTGGVAQGGTELRVGSDFVCVIDIFSEKLRVIDVREQTNPVLVDSIPLAPTLTGLDVEGSFAYVVGHGSQDLKVIQLFCMPTVSVDPLSGKVFESPAVSWQRNGGDLYNLNPAGVGIGTSDPSARLHIAGDLKIADGTESEGYVLTSDSMGLASWQMLKAQSLLSTPVSTEDLCLYVAAEKPIGSEPRKVRVQAQHAYVLDLMLDSMYVIDISLPANPVLVGQVKVGDAPQTLFVSGDYAYTVSLLEGLEVIDITDPTNPTVVGSEDLGFLFPSPNDVFVLGDYAYVVDDGNDDNFKVIDVSNPLLPSTDGSMSLGNPVAVYVQGNYAFVVDDGTDELRIIDVSNPASPSQAGSEPIGTLPRDIVVEGDYAYVIDRGSDDLKVIDVSFTAFPSVIANLPVGALPAELFVDGTNAYVIDESSNKLQVIDISNPAVPVARADIAVGFAPVSVSVLDNYAYTVDYVNDAVIVVNLICEPNIFVDPASGNLVDGEPSAWSWTGSNISNSNGGNVGIGTTTPSEELVVGDDFGVDMVGTRLTISNDTATSGLNIGEDIDNRAWLLWDRFDNLVEMGTRALGVDYSGTLILKDNKVGLGMGGASPSENLVVATDLGDFSGTRITVGDASNFSGINLGEDSDNRAWILWNNSDDQVELGTRASGVNYSGTLVLEDGKVGVGTGSPGTKLHVSGGDQLIDRGSTTEGLERSLTIGGARFASGNAFAAINFVNYDSNSGTGNYTGARITSENSSGSGSGDIRFSTTDVFNMYPVERMIIDRDGRVGIGTNDTRSLLTLRGPDDVNTGPIITLFGNNSDQPESGRIRFVEGTAVNNWRGGFIHYDGNANQFNIGVHNTSDNNPANDNNAISIERGNGNVGIGTESPGQRLEVNGNIYSSGGDFYAAVGGGVINAGGGLMSSTYNIISDNAVSPSFVDGDEDLFIQDDLEVSGQGYKPGGGDWGTLSDARLKKNIARYTDGLAQVLQINPVTYRYNDRVSVYDHDKEYVGIIAQDMLDVAPYTVELSPLGQLVEEDEEGNEIIIRQGTEYYTFDGSALTYMLINAVKEQQAIIDAQSARIDELQNLQQQFTKLQERMARYEATVSSTTIEKHN